MPDQWYAVPAFYSTNPYAVQGPDDDARIPPGSSLFDFELEVAAVIGRGGRSTALSAGDTVVLTVERLGRQTTTVLPADIWPREDLSATRSDRRTR